MEAAFQAWTSLAPGPMQTPPAKSMPRTRPTTTTTTTWTTSTETTSITPTTPEAAATVADPPTPPWRKPPWMRPRAKNAVEEQDNEMWVKWFEAKPFTMFPNSCDREEGLPSSSKKEEVKATQEEKKAEEYEEVTEEEMENAEETAPQDTEHLLYVKTEVARLLDQNVAKEEVDKEDAPHKTRRKTRSTSSATSYEETPPPRRRTRRTVQRSRRNSRDPDAGSSRATLE